MRALYLLLASASLLTLTSCEERSTTTSEYTSEPEVVTAADTIGETYYSPSYYRGSSARYYADPHSSYNNRYSPLYHQNFAQASRSPLATQHSYHIVRVVPRVSSKPNTSSKSAAPRYSGYRATPSRTYVAPARTYRAPTHISTMHSSPHVSTSHVSTSHASSGGHH